MFVELLEECMGSTDPELDERLRENELAMRRLQAERAAVTAVSSARGAYRQDGHRTVNGYLQATLNVSTGAATELRRVAEACDAVPELGDALMAGRIGVVQVLEIARIRTNPRTRAYFGRVAPIYLELAEHDSHKRLRRRIDDFLALADQDGAFAELACDVSGRTAQVHVVGSTLDVRVHGGDPLVADEVVATFDLFVEAEFQADVDARRAEYGDAAGEYPLARTDRQRRFDAFIAMARRARAHLAAAKPAGAADVTVNLIGDLRTWWEVFDRAGLVTTRDGQVVELDDETAAAVISTAAADPADWVDRHCHTADGTPVHPIVLLQAAMTAHVRRVVVDADGVVIDRGRAVRLFEGEARAAAKLLFTECSHPGCNVTARLADVDHIDEWHEGGRTDQRNADIRCRSQNRAKHRERWRTRRDEHGRPFTVRADGSIMLPVGARPPDLSYDELGHLARRRLSASLDPAS